jgi:hypothetical protein
MKDWRTYLNFSMTRQIMTGFIVTPRTTGQRRICEGLAFVLILLTPWWLWQQQETSSLDPSAIAPLSKSNSLVNPFNHSQSP